MVSRTCLVTGAGRGIGREVAVRLSAQGHKVALTARTAGELADTAAACGGDTLALPADITAPDAPEELFAAVEERFGPVEVLVANAGRADSAPLHRITDDDWQAILDVNLTAPFRCLRRAVPAMTAAGWGRIVVVASVAARRGEPYIAAYTASKHGVLGLVRSAAAELARTGVTVNAVCPAYVDTAMTARNMERISELTGRPVDETRKLFAAKQPIGRLVTAGEVADAVMLCIGNAAITGQGIDVDGGAVQA